MSSRVYCRVCGLEISRSNAGFSPYSAYAASDHPQNCGRDKSVPYHCLRCGFFSEPRRFVVKTRCPQCHIPIVRQADNPNLYEAKSDSQESNDSRRSEEKE